MDTTVTLDKTYFETLLRRAEFHTSGKDITTPLDLQFVSIPKLDHDYLLRMAQEYAALQDSLRKGGITQETLELLIHGEGDTFPGTERSQSRHIDESATVPPRTPTTTQLKGSDTPEFDIPHGNWLSSPGSMAYEPAWRNTMSRRQLGRSNSSFNDETVSASHIVGSRNPQPDRPSFARTEKRTILLKGLPDGTTHKALAECIRGGIILDIFLRPIEQVASISFVEGSAARQFFNYAKRHDMYIGAKRIEIQWSDRQFVLPGHIGYKVGNGATRNLMIRDVLPVITEEQIRDDLDHIHNLVVIDVSFCEGNAYIELNSIHNSIFARTCMMSRARYKGMRIEWYPDECAQPINNIPVVLAKEKRATASTEKLASNRFQSLAMDGTEDGSTDDTEPQSEVLSEISNLKIRMCASRA